MKKASLEAVVELSLPHLIQAGKVNENPSEQELAWVSKLVSLYHEQMSYGAEIVELSALFFNENLDIDDESKAVLSDETAPVVIQAMKAKLAELSEADFVADNIKPLTKQIQKETGVKGRNLFMPIRIAVSGQMHGPELPLLIEVLGKEKAINHIEQVMTQI